MVGLVWVGFSGVLETGGGDPIIVHCNGENGSGDLPHHVCVADTGELDCHSSVLAASRLIFLSEKLARPWKESRRCTTVAIAAHSSKARVILVYFNQERAEQSYCTTVLWSDRTELMKCSEGQRS